MENDGPDDDYESTDGEPNATPPNYSTDWSNLDERRRARIRREAGGASRDLVSESIERA